MPLTQDIMKFTTILLVLSIAFVYSCKDTPDRPGAILDENYEPIVPTNTPPAATTTPPATNEPPQNAQGVWHYTCPSGCVGGAGGASPCATCGTTLVHNQAYHAAAGGAGTPPVVTPTTTATTSNGSPVGSITNPVINGIGGAGSTAPGATKVPGVGTATPAAEPPQNAAGVWHYICNAGCAGGAGSAVACAGCGATLAHNTAYHQ